MAPGPVRRRPTPSGAGDRASSAVPEPRTSNVWSGSSLKESAFARSCRRERHCARAYRGQPGGSDPAAVRSLRQSVERRRVWSGWRPRARERPGRLRIPASSRAAENPGAERPAPVHLRREKVEFPPRGSELQRQVSFAQVPRHSPAHRRAQDLAAAAAWAAEGCAGTAWPRPDRSAPARPSAAGRGSPPSSRWRPRGSKTPARRTDRPPQRRRSRRRGSAPACAAGLPAYAASERSQSPPPTAS